MYLVRGYKRIVFIWELIISRRITRNFTRNPIVNPPCRNSYVDEFINIGVYTFILRGAHDTRDITVFDRNSLYLIGWSLSSPRACITSCTQASYQRSLPLKRDKIKLPIYSSAAAKMSSPLQRLKAYVNRNSIKMMTVIFI